jgi:hypothetical protein
MKLKHLLLAVTVTCIALPVAALAFVKPWRVVAPALMPGVACPLPDICIDDVARLGDAQALYRAGYAKAASAVRPFRQSPRVVFCTTQACADTFGLGQRAAEAIGNVGMVVAPRGWQAFYVAHELIHHRQAEALGNYAVATRPRWLIEGMAYALSGDPRHPLGAPFEQWRSQFEAWHADVGAHDLWEAAREVR